MTNTLLAVVVVFFVIAAGISDLKPINTQQVATVDSLALKKELTQLQETYLDSFMCVVLSHEGGYSNDPDDLGGETMKGITWTTYVSVTESLGLTVSYDEFRTMPKDVWKRIFKEFYMSIKPDMIQSAGVQIALADFFWGSGIYGASLKTKQMLKQYNLPVTEGSVWRELDAQSLNSLDPTVAILEIHNMRSSIADRYPKYKNGWMRRINHITKLSKECVNLELAIVS